MALKDVAKIAGVSISTVSRVINSGNEKSATKEVRDRIWEAVRECGYVPNKTAQNLKLGKTEIENTLRVSILFARRGGGGEDYFFSELENHVKEAISACGMIVGKSYDVAHIEELDEELSQRSKNEGVVVLGRINNTARRILNSWKQRIVCITLNRAVLDIDHMVSDGEMAAEIAMDYLHRCGHKKIAYIGEYLDEVRYRGYKNFLIKNKLPVLPEYVINTSMTIEGGKKAVEYFKKIQNMPTALFCANDVTAIGVISSLAEIGIRVPNDISVISIDNIAEAGNCLVPLSTVKIPVEEMSKFAVKTLKDRMEKGHEIQVQMFMPAELVVRDSVAINKK